jgi:hypothetical protein
MLTTVIVDDQEICTEMLLDTLGSVSADVNTAAIPNSGAESIKAIRKHKTSLVILKC